MHSEQRLILQRASDGSKGAIVAIEGGPAVLSQYDLSFSVKESRLAAIRTRLVLGEQRQSRY